MAERKTRQFPIGIMQGRLTPSEGKGIQFFPFENWEKEFDFGKEIGVDEIEWIFDYERYAENPLWTKEGCQAIIERSKATGVKVNSVCFDYFMRRPFFKGKGSREENMEYFSRVLDGMERIGASLIEIPLVDDSSIKNGEEREKALELARDMADKAARKKMVVGFETDMPPGIFRTFLDDIARKNIAANYDSGNSSGLGYDHREELLSLGTMVANVHIKDRVFQNGTVKLGTGSADFDKVFSSLKDVGYQGSFILQAARGIDGDEKNTILGQIQFVEKYLRKYELGA